MGFVAAYSGQYGLNKTRLVVVLGSADEMNM